MKYVVERRKSGNVEHYEREEYIDITNIDYYPKPRSLLRDVRFDGEDDI